MDAQNMLERIVKLEQGHARLADAIADNTTLTKEVHENTQELLELFIATKSGIKVLGWLARAIKFMAALTAACAAAYVAVKNLFGN